MALSLGLPPLDVIQHPALRSSDFPQTTPFGLLPAIVWPTRMSDYDYSTFFTRLVIHVPSSLALLSSHFNSFDSQPIRHLVIMIARMTLNFYPRDTAF